MQNKPYAFSAQEFYSYAWTDHNHWKRYLDFFNFLFRPFFPQLLPEFRELEALSAGLTRGLYSSSQPIN